MAKGCFHSTPNQDQGDTYRKKYQPEAHNDNNVFLKLHFDILTKHANTNIAKNRQFVFGWPNYRCF